MHMQNETGKRPWTRAQVERVVDEALDNGAGEPADVPPPNGCDHYETTGDILVD
jgi:protoheme ferro-lyase